MNTIFIIIVSLVLNIIGSSLGYGTNLVTNEEPENSSSFTYDELEFQNLTNQLQHLKDATDYISLQINTISTSFEKEMAVMKSFITQEIKEMIVAVQTADNKILNEDCSSIKIEIDDLQNSLSTNMKSEMVNLQNMLQSQVNTIGTNTKMEMDDLQKSISTNVMSEISDLRNSSLANIKSEMSDLQNSLSTNMKSEFVDLKNSISANMKDELDDLKKSLSINKKSEIAFLSNYLSNNMKSEITDLQNSLSNSVKNEFGNLRNMLQPQVNSIQTSMKSEMHDLQNSLSTNMKSEIGDLRNSLSTNKKCDMDDFKNMLQPQINLICTNMKNEMDDLKKSLSSDIKSEIVDLTKAINKSISSVVQTEKSHGNSTDIVPESCVEALQNGGESGIYKLHLPSSGLEPFDVYCLKDSMNGPAWTVVQRRQDGSVDFNRNWEEYKNGFGNLKTEFFLGLEKLYALTNQTKSQQLWIKLVDWAEESRSAKYKTVKIGDESSKYMLLQLNDYRGDAGDSLSSSVEMQFSTKNSDNDNFSDGSLAKLYRGAWWFGIWPNSNLNGEYLRGDLNKNINNFGRGIIWLDWGGYYYSFKYSHMALRPSN